MPSRCFVIQPFDKGQFDKRYDDIFVPAIEKAGFEAYRVDRDPSVVIPIETIEEFIRNSDVCLADITLDNANIWYEVGYAFALNKDIAMVCSEDRSTFPFDVRHRAIITYANHSTRDFQGLGDNITQRLKAFSQRAKTIREVPYLKATEGLAPHEMVVLIICMEGRLTPDSGESPHSIQIDMNRAGYTKIATTMAIESLRRKKFIENSMQIDDHGSEYEIYKVTETGLKWCFENQDKFLMKEEPSPSRGYGPPAPRRLPPPQPPAEEKDGDDIPF